MTTLTKRYRFCASHRLHSEYLSEAENQRIYGKCNNPYGHGHDYVLEVSIAGEVDAETGLFVNLSSLDAFVAEEVLARFDYRNLNHDVAEFAALVPTTENLALVIAGRLQQQWSGWFPGSRARLSGVALQETDRNSFEVVLSKPDVRQKFATVESNESVSLNA